MLLKNDFKYKQYYTIDILKFIMALCVVAIHTDPVRLIEDTNIYIIYRSIVKMAVPFFFIATGFLLADKISHNNNTFEKIGSHIKKLLKIYILWNIIYMPLAVYHYYDLNYSVLHSVLDYIRGFIFIGEHYNSYILWYILSSIYALIFILLLVKCKFDSKSMLICGCIIWIIAYTFTLYTQDIISVPNVIDKGLSLLVKIIVSGRIFMGFFYIPLGIFLYEHKTDNIMIGIILFVISFVLNIISPETGYIYEAGRILGTTGIFIAALNIKLKYSDIYGTLREMSSTIYFIHLWIWTIIYAIIYREKTYGLLPFVMTASISCLVAYIFRRYKLFKKADMLFNWISEKLCYK